MKKTTVLLVVLATVLFAMPALAREHETTGDRLNIGCPPPEDPEAVPPFECSLTQDYPANTAFYISHGWVASPRTIPGQARFELEVDGVSVQPTYKEFTRDHEEPEFFLWRFWFFNFPEGLTGTHTFEGHWILPCVYVLPDCPNPMADVDMIHSEFLITFD